MNNIEKTLLRCRKVAVGLYGAGAFAREVLPFLKVEFATRVAAFPNLECFFCLIETEPSKSSVNGYPVLSEEAFFNLDCAVKLFNVALSNPRDRERLAARCLSLGGVPLTTRSPHSIEYDANEIGEGAILCANTMITSNVKIGRFFQSNIYSYIGHDCVIGDFVTFAPRVSCNGNIHIRDRVYIGTGAILRPGFTDRPLVIGEDAIIGMGAVVTKDVPAGITVYGNPARARDRGPVASGMIK